MSGRAVRAFTAGTLAVGILDGLDAVLFWGFHGVGPLRVFQAVASGLLGRAAFAGGVPTFLLGLALHFSIAFFVVAAYYRASRSVGFLRRHYVVCGLLYGLAVHVVMQHVVLPAVGLGATKTSLAALLNGYVAHATLVGLPAAWVSRDVS